MKQTSVEPWLRGTHMNVPALQRAVLHAFELAQEDVDRWTHGLTLTELEARPMRLPPVAFHMRHIAGSLDRLLTYAEARTLSARQLEQLGAEQVAATSAESLRATFAEAMERAGERLLRFAPTEFDELRTVGRLNLPTTLAGLLIHCAEHTQRHTGQLITTANLLLAQRHGGQR